jgi:hypothetical protein
MSNAVNNAVYCEVCNSVNYAIHRTVFYAVYHAVCNAVDVAVKETP